MVMVRAIGGCCPWCDDNVGADGECECPAAYEIEQLTRKLEIERTRSECNGKAAIEAAAERDDLRRRLRELADDRDRVVQALHFQQWTRCLMCDAEVEIVDGDGCCLSCGADFVTLRDEVAGSVLEGRTLGDPKDYPDVRAAREQDA